MLGTKSLQSLQTPTSQSLKATSHLQKVDLFNIKLQHQPINDYHSIIKYKPLVVKKEQNWRQCIMSIHSSPQNLIKKPKKNTMITKKKPQLLYSSIKENLWKQKEKEKKIPEHKPWCWLHHHCIVLPQLLLLGLMAALTSLSSGLVKLESFSNVFRGKRDTLLASLSLSESAFAPRFKA